MRMDGVDASHERVELMCSRPPPPEPEPGPGSHRVRHARVWCESIATVGVFTSDQRTQRKHKNAHLDQLETMQSAGYEWVREQVFFIVNKEIY